MKIIQIFSEGQLFPESVLNVSEDELLEKFMSGVKTIASISLAINYPTLASVTHSLVNSYKNLLAIALATDITFEGAEKAKAYLENPEAFAVAAPAASDAPAAEEKKEEAVKDEEESDDDSTFSLLSLSRTRSRSLTLTLSLRVHSGLRSLRLNGSFRSRKGIGEEKVVEHWIASLYRVWSSFVSSLLSVHSFVVCQFEMDSLLFRIASFRSVRDLRVESGLCPPPIFLLSDCIPIGERRHHGRRGNSTFSRRRSRDRNRISN
jgi:hypothetical protein